MQSKSSKIILSILALALVTTGVVTGIIGLTSSREEETSEPAIMGESDKKQEVKVLIDAQGTSKTYFIDYRAGEKAIETLDRLQQTQGFDYEAQDYDFGLFITSINNIAPNENQFWGFNVNGETASVGVSDYEIKPEDEISFVLTELD